LFALKLELIEESSNKFRYMLKPDFSTEGAWEIFSFLRFAFYDEDQSFLLIARNQVHELKRNQFLQQGGKIEDWNPKGQFNGSETNYCTLRCERNMFKNLARLCLKGLSKFKTTI